MRPEFDPHRTSALKTLVLGTRRVLVFQVLAACIATATALVVLLQIRPLIDQRDALQLEIAAQRLEFDKRQIEADRLRAEIDSLNADLTSLRDRIGKAREATRFTSAAIQQYHNRNYGNAIVAYDKALALDPENPWILDLKSYSQFRAGEIEAAIATVEQALRLVPDYAYGYTELTRYQCSAHRWDDAVATARTAAKRLGNPAADLYRDLFETDGQFARLCKPTKVKILALLEGAL